MPEQDYAAVDADDPDLLSSELSSQPYESSSDDLHCPLPTIDDLASFDVSLSNTPPQASDSPWLQPHTLQAHNPEPTSHPSLVSANINVSPQQLLLSEDALPPQPQSCRLNPAPRPFPCRECGRRFLERRQLSNHLRNEHRRFTCTDCGKEYRQNKSLWQHQRETHKGFVIECDQCDYTTGRRWNLQRHQDYKHPSKDDS